ncbi:MAG: TIGR04255 family protein [Planctomycetales bacterium]|nr:TIGR04255 family protein [Planctomycetales bacterium]
MTFELGRPPIIEAWIRANFQPATETEWNWSDVANLIATYEQELCELEMLPSATPVARHLKKGQLPKEVLIKVEPRYLRARTTDRTRIVQVGQNELIVVQGRGADSGYPGFTKLLQDFMEALTRYRDHLTPLCVDSVELHYADLVVIPNMFLESLELADLFDGAPSLPADPYGNMAAVSWSIGLVCPNSTDFAELAVQMQPPDEDNGRFRLDWHRYGCELADDSPAAIAERLRIAHNYLKECFRTVCKDPVWLQFDPQ